MEIALFSQSNPGIKYELALNITGLMTNCVFRAYEVVDGVKTYYPELDKIILAIDISEGTPSEQQAAYGIMVALQTFINQNNY